jgi:tetratricopeptide (TPR) repeat protein
LAGLVSCARRDTQRTVPQVAVLRFENFSADPSLDWMGRAFSEILSAELQGSPQRYSIQYRDLHSFDAALGGRPAGAPGISTERTGALAAGANQFVYGGFAVVDGMLRATATQEELATHRMQIYSASGPVAAGILPVASALARQLGETQPFGTSSSEALLDYVQALESPNPDAADDLGKATAADPDFGRAWVAWLSAAIAHRDRALADSVVAQASTHRQRFSGIDRAQFDLEAAALRADFPAQLQARRDLCRLDPADPNHHRALAQALMSVRQFDEAIVEFRRGLSIRPDDVAALNTMGYAAAYSGDLPTAIRVLRGYEQLRPNEPNPLDSLGDVHFALGRFGEAEQFYLAAYAKAPAFLNGGELLKAAQARLMTGDVSGATALFKRFVAAREAAHDPNSAYHAAAWSWQTGARRAAVASLDTFARAYASGPLHELAARADAQIAFWLLNLGDRPGAIDHARKAVAEAGPATAPLVAMLAFLAQPEVFLPPAQPPLNDYARAYAALFGKQFGPAAQLLQNLYQRPASELDDGSAVLLAWAYEETGDWQRAGPLLRLTPLPQASGFPMFSAFYFPRIFLLREAILDREGHHQEAARYYQLFRALSGPDSDIWAEQQRIR